MTELIDKEKILKALREEEATCLSDRIMRRINKGEFDAEPEPVIRTLPACPGSLKTRKYNMVDPESRFAYLLDITDELLSYRNTHLEKHHTPVTSAMVALEKRVVLLETPIKERNREKKPCIINCNHPCRQGNTKCDWNGSRCSEGYAK